MSVFSSTWFLSSGPCAFLDVFLPHERQKSQREPARGRVTHTEHCVCLEDEGKEAKTLERVHK